ncbi:unnamed protein product [Effrenium voratum]|uniref:DNA helicase n=1 Tax=Effrenium voratum TaxID=2562239 RepID=A0AA36J0R0_9DINO|nr:unnamed protein product [Effrenium voratum]CAJ1460913.1 unnamed protein product [Effrenium voratum]
MEASQAVQECSICNEEVGSEAEAMHCLGATGGLQHRFHGLCLRRWVESCRSRAAQPSCPNCRGPVEIHAERLASQLDEASVQEFLANHAASSAGWVRLGESSLDSLQRRFDALDLALAQTREEPQRHPEQTGLEEDPIQEPWRPRKPCPLASGNCRQRLQVGEVEVLFPFQSVLPPQQQVITKVVNGALQGRHVLIESPTGTGKTMALLCAALAAQRRMALLRGKAPRVIFGTRTHAQIKQVVNEVRRSPYRPWLQVVGGRDQNLCIQPRVLEQARTDDALSSQACRLARRGAERGRNSNVVAADGRVAEADVKCDVWLPLQELSVVAGAHQQMRSEADGSGGMLDMEDLAALGGRLNCCPYFLSRAALANAELVICPYNYLLGEQLAVAMGLDERDIVIIDEGHNLEDYCCEIGSESVTGSTLLEILNRIEEAEIYLQEFRSEGVDFLRLSLVKTTVQAIQRLCSEVMDVGPGSTWNSTLEARPSVMEFLERAGVEQSFVGAVRHFQEVLQGRRGVAGSARMEGLSMQVLKSLRELEGLAAALARCIEAPRQFKIHLEAVGVSARGTVRSSQSQRASQEATVGASDFELSILLVRPEAVFQPLADSAHCVIVASGTLAPVAAFQVALGPAFCNRLLPGVLEAPHVISSSQLGVVFVGSGPSRSLRCTREPMAQSEFLQDLGKLLLLLLKEIPGGVLVFMPSKKGLEDAQHEWRQSLGLQRSLWERLREVKGCVQMETESEALRRHQDAASEGAVLFCVYRGRASEGLSLSDVAVRGVICVGIPLRPLNPAVRLKRSYYDQVKPNGKNGEDWYSQDAHRAVNQALGRAVRHRQDYGAVVLVDERWTCAGSMRAVRYLPKWLRELIGINDGIRGQHLAFHLEKVLQSLRQHFARHAGEPEDFQTSRMVRPRTI